VPPDRSIVAEPLNTPKARRLAGIRSVTARGAKVFAGALLVLWLAGPIVWVIVASTQTRLIQQVPPRLVAPSLTQYQRLVTDPAWQGAAAVSFSVTVIATALALAIAILTAYPLARYRWRGGRPLLAVMLGTQLVPPIALAIPVLFLFAALGLRNSILGLVLVNVAFWTPLLIWLTRSAFLATPANLERAARIDGSSRLGAIFRIALPAAGPAIAAAAAIVFIGIWNDFVFAVSLGGPDTSTLPRYLGQSFAPSYAALSAAIVVTVAPCVALVALFRRRIFQLV
jgi:multiple sugar transport system permease protein